MGISRAIVPSGHKEKDPGSLLNPLKELYILSSRKEEVCFGSKLKRKVKSNGFLFNHVMHIELSNK